MSPELSTALPLVGGFWFVLRCRALYLVSLQLRQVVVVLFSAFFACIFVLLTRFLILLIGWMGWHQNMERLSFALWPVPFSGTGIGAFLVAVTLAEVSALALKLKTVNSWVIGNFAGELVKLLHASMLRIKPVSLTLDNRKFYIGFVQGIPSLDPDKAFVRLLPILSGYRHEKELTFRFTTHYAGALAAAEDVNDFIVIIRLSDVKVANLFDPAVHRRHFSPKAPPDPEATAASSS